MRLRRPGVAVAVAVTLVLTGCTSSKRDSSTPTTRVATTSAPTTPASSSRPAPSSAPAPVAFRLALQDVPALPPEQALPAGEVERTCPYIKAGLNIDPDPAGQDFANLEGSRVQRVTVLTTLKPVGCRFYYQYDYHPVGDILPSTYATPTDAYNAMVVTAKAGTEVLGVPSFVPGVDGISFRTHLYAADAGQDWAFVFAKGNVMVVVRTDQKSPATNAENIAKAIVGKF